MPAILRIQPVRGLRLQALEEVSQFALRSLEAAEVDPGVAYATAAVAEELCTNVLEHSQAASLELELGRRGDTAYVVLRDDGDAFDPGVSYRNEADTFVLEKKTDRRLGLYIVHQLARSVNYRRSEKGWNEVEVEILPGELLAPPPAKP